MFTKLFISLLYCHIVSSQINGEFWWLNEKVAQLHNLAPPQPKIEDISEFETDESVKVVFRDHLDHFDTAKEKNDTNMKGSENDNSSSIYFKDISALGIPNHEDSLNKDKLINTESESPQNVSSLVSFTSSAASSTTPISEDVLNFVFPDDNDVVENKNRNKTHEVKFQESVSDAINIPKSILTRAVNKIQDSESICTFIKAINCRNSHGIPYSFNGRPLSGQNMHNDLIVCCIMPLKTYDKSEIYFPDTAKHHRRFRRSDNNERENPAMRQRNALLKRKYQLQSSESKMSTTTSPAIITQRIVTPEDNFDPYWNVKNSKFRKPSSPESISAQNSDSNFDYSNQEYADEIPQPGGLLGSDHNKGWTLIKPTGGYFFSGSDEVSDEGEDSFGYSTIDPRLGRPMAISESRLKPYKITPTGEDSGGSVVSFRSKPDFQVLHGFKLLNLVPTKNRFVRKTTQSEFHNDKSMEIKPYKAAPSLMVDYEEYVDLDEQVYRNCGKSSNNVYDTEKELDIVGKGSTPWVALIVLTRSRQSILCYATLVHPRAAITAADCVHGTSAGEISIIAGIFDLADENSPSQHRVTNVITHPQYKPGQLNHNLAVLHWTRSLILGSLVQPACMSDPYLGDECYFVGWGGYDEAIRQRPRWQRASILSPKVCNVRLNKLDVKLPTDAFCASVKTPGSVTGVGGPLLCASGDRQSVVGVAVWRDGLILTAPVLEWAAGVVRDMLN
ncbi:unnamed protein product [Pieris macdunnoughi]|uniref:Peptidase S1 domain-containing protein n=1 Tax=Pieris macdunnoughi TaxID=345717 RepID=A0A821TMI4_9NEOP|nr:unnamed protein product [Pieris macdunnoughi]